MLGVELRLVLVVLVHTMISVRLVLQNHVLQQTATVVASSRKHVFFNSNRSTCENRTLFASFCPCGAERHGMQYNNEVHVPGTTVCPSHTHRDRNTRVW